MSASGAEAGQVSLDAGRPVHALGAGAGRMDAAALLGQSQRDVGELRPDDSLTPACAV